MSLTRSQFLKVLGVSASASLSSIHGFSAQPPAVATSKVNKTDLRMGLASYTLRKFNLDEVIRISQRLGLNSIALKSMHMTLESSAEEIKSVAEKVRNAGLKMYGAGVISRSGGVTVSGG